MKQSYVVVCDVVRATGAQMSKETTKRMVRNHRMVIVSKYVKSSSGVIQKEDAGEAIFHQWGVDYEEFESGPGQYSVAIVEYKDGAIGMIRADMVRFVQPNPSDQRPGAKETT